MKTPYNERRGQINKKYIKKNNLNKLATELEEYSPKDIVNMDENFVITYNFRIKTEDIRN